MPSSSPTTRWRRWARRVGSSGPGGLVAASLFAEPERCESTAIHLAMAALSPPARQASHQPYALSAPQGLERALTASGLDVELATEVPVVWRYADADAAVRGLLSSGGGARAIQDVGRDGASRPPYAGSAGTHARLQSDTRYRMCRALRRCTTSSATSWRADPTSRAWYRTSGPRAYASRRR